MNSKFCISGRKISPNNFVSVINYEELEDTIYFYNTMQPYFSHSKGLS